MAKFDADQLGNRCRVVLEQTDTCIHGNGSRSFEGAA